MVMEITEAQSLLLAEYYVKSAINIKKHTTTDSHSPQFSTWCPLKGGIRKE